MLGINTGHFYHHYLKVNISGDKIAVNVQRVTLPGYTLAEYLEEVASPNLNAFIQFYGFECALLLFAAWAVTIFIQEKKRSS